MNHAITIGGLLLSVGYLVGLGMLAFGVLSAFANMMADAAGDNGKQGCTFMAAGVLIIGFCIAIMILS